MRNSGLLKWVPTGVNKNNKLTSNKDKDEKGKDHRLWSGSVSWNIYFGNTINNTALILSGSKKWIHNPETLKNGHVSYLVKVRTFYI